MNLITVKMTLVLFMLCSGFVHSTFALNRLRIFSFPKMNDSTWDKSLNKCKNENGSFVTVYDKDDINFMNDYLIQKYLNGFFWLGLRKSRYNVSTWSNGVPYIFHISNVTLTDGRQICEGLENNTWTGFDCSEEKHFMCYKGNNYTLIESEKKNWCQAQLYCRRYFTDLVSISNETQNQQVIDKGKNKTFWIGLMHDEWEWEDNSCSTYREWNSPTPGDDCTALNGNLQTKDCEDAKAMCSKGHVRIKVINQSLTWEEAFQYCEVNHTGLLQIEDEQDQDAVKQWLSYAGVNGSFWIGLRQSRVFGFWIWHNRTVTYSNWRNGRQPEMPMSNHCGAISNIDYKWSDENCWLQLPFLCEEEISFKKK